MLTLLGASHHDAPLHVRERLTVGADELPPLLRALAARFGAGAILATCNRFEVYLPGVHDPGAVVGFLVEQGGFDRELADRYLRLHRDAEAVRHLYAVAAGIDSMVLGESEILGQVREAFSACVAASADHVLLSRLFHTAIRVGRRARTETAIGQHAISVSSIAVQQARALCPVLEQGTVLVIGAGEAGRLAAEALVQRGVGRVLVANRTAARAAALAAELGGRAVPFDALAEAMAESDVVIAASAAPEHLVSRAQVLEAVGRRDGKPLVVIDIGMPRDFEPAAAEVPGVLYRDLDALQAIADDHLRAREAEVARVVAIVDEEQARFVEWWRQLEVVPIIAALTDRAEQLRRAEIAKSRRRLGLTPGQDQQLDALTRAIVKQLLHDPITTLREHGDRELYLDVARVLFRLDHLDRGDAPPQPVDLG